MMIRILPNNNNNNNNLNIKNKLKKFRPLRINRLMNILSVNTCRILGSTQKNQDNFKNTADDGSFKR
jgi:hypothetical protein